MDTKQINYMVRALEEARAAEKRGEVPIGAIIVNAANGDIIAQSGNTTEAENDPTGHAEMRVIQAAAKQLGAPRLPDCDLYVTLEPCPMCAAAISFARIRRVYFGAYDPKGGGVEHGPKIFDHPTCHHKPEIYGGIEEQQCADLLKTFFQSRR